MRPSQFDSNLLPSHAMANGVVSALRNVFACLLLMGFASQLQAQVSSAQSSLGFGSVAVGATTGITQSVSFTIPSGLTLGGISAVTEGAPNLDFTVVPGGTCAGGSTSTTCTVNVQFLPTAVGTRLGAVVLTDQSGNTLIAVPINGVGNGPLVAFGPGIISTAAGNGAGGYTGDGGAAISAQLGQPTGVAIDGAGDFYIAASMVIRKVTPGGTISTVAGNGSCTVITNYACYNGDNIPATSAELSYPMGVALDGAGNLYIADEGDNRIRKVSPGGIITTVAGNGSYGYTGDGGSATSATLNAPMGVAVDGAGNLYIADWGNDVVRKVTPSGIITTLAGNGTAGYAGDGGPATSAKLMMPEGIALDGFGNLYIPDPYHNVVRAVTPGGTITTVAGNGSCAVTNAFGECYNGDEIPAIEAELDGPSGVALDSGGDLYIVDRDNERIRKVAPSGIITTVAGTAVGGYNGDNIGATNAELNFPFGVAVDGLGNLYIADEENNRVRKVYVLPPSLTFSSTSVGTTSTSQDVIVLNLGNVSLNISQISTAANFSLGGADTTCSSTGQTLNAAESCVLGIEFNPKADGSISGSVVLTDNALNASTATQTIPLQGTGTGQVSQTITFPNPGTQTYGVSPVTLAATATSGLPVSYTVTSGPATVSGSTLTITGAGTVTVQAIQPGDGVNYAAATPVSVSVIVNQAVPTVSFTGAPGSSGYNATFTVFATTNASSAAVITASGACTIAGNVVTITSGTGTCTLSANWAADGNYLAASATQSATATTASQAITVGTQAPGSAAYGSSFSVAATASSGLTVAYASSGGCTNSGATFTMQSPTTACSVVFNQAGNTNYAAATQVAETVTAAKATQTITVTTAAPSSAAYKSTFPVVATASSGLTVAINVSGGCTVSGGTITMNSPTTACTVTFNQTGNADYNAATQVAETAAAAKATQTIAVATAAPASAAYSGKFTVAATASSGLAVAYTSSGGCTNSGATFTMTSGTTGCAVQFNQAGNTDYSATQATETVTATKVTQTITFTNPGTKTYGVAPITLTAKATSGLSASFTVTSGPATVSGSTLTITGAGTVTVQASQPGDGVNYAAATPVSVSFTVNKATSTATIKSETPNPSIKGQAVVVGFTVSGAGIAPTGTVTMTGTGNITCTGILSADAGSCSLTFTTTGSKTLTAAYSGDSNYNSSTSAKVTQKVQP